MKRAYFYLILCALFISACNQKENQCKETVNGFFKAVKNEDPAGMKIFYPKVEQLLSYYKSDSITIKDINEAQDEKYIVEINNLYTNGFGKKFDRDITLYLKPTEDKKKMIIYDSKGLIGLNDNKEYAYAKRHGSITDKEETDIQISGAVRAAIIEPVFRTEQIKRDLADGALVQGKINWQKFYGSANGNFIVKNTYNIRLKNLKYIVHFYSGRDGAEITQDDGFVKVGDLMPGESTSASFYTSFVGNSNWAKVSLHIDEDDLYEALLEK